MTIEVDFAALDASLQRMRAFQAQPHDRPPPMPVECRDPVVGPCAGCGRVAIQHRGGFCYACKGDPASAWLFKRG